MYVSSLYNQDRALNMETLFFIICSGFFGYIYQKLEKMEGKIDRLEEDILTVKMSSPKRKSDHTDFVLE